MQIITTHRSTDFDGFASVIAGTILYPGAIPVLPKALNPNVKAFLSIHKDLFEISTIDEIDQTEVKRLIVVDTGQWARLEKMSGLKKNKNLEIFLWDHHENQSDLNPNWKCQEKIGANITLMIREIKKQNILLTPIQATLFLTGLYEDTGSLTFPSSTAEDAYTAGYLLENKADLNILSTFLQPAYGEKQKNILFAMLKAAPRTKIDNYTVSINTMHIEGHVNNLSLVVNMYRDILNVDAAFGIFVHKDHEKCIVIGRSSVEDINVGLIMRSMGGGGHPGAGSAMIKSVNPSALNEWLLELLKGNQQGSVLISDLMSYPVFSVTSDAPMSEVANLLKEKGCTGLPVVDDEKLVGVISRRDFKKIRKASQLKSPVKAFMNTRNITIEPDKSPIEAARIMVKHDIGRLPVVKDDRIIGIMSRSDAMLYFYDLLPD
ncbi:MAG: CBS domain-containing protein [Desulfobacteraceae bacterium]|nr:CBS domain-containing protein [Desulfobacteraceae bacterium]MBC2756897.1 CBS domain-containing protein [Desulfobacteraceae bacterium]